jgi:hypothetical protein
MMKSRSELDPLIIVRGRGAITARRKRAGPHAEASESTVYAGRDAVGSILVVRRGRVTALDAAGKRLGTFKTDREAMGVIIRKARETAR